MVVVMSDDWTDAKWMAVELVARKGLTYPEICKKVGVCRKTLHKWRQESAFKKAVNVVRRDNVRTMREAGRAWAKEKQLLADALDREVFDKMRKDILEGKNDKPAWRYGIAVRNSLLAMELAAYESEARGDLSVCPSCYSDAMITEVEARKEGHA